MLNNNKGNVEIQLDKSIRQLKLKKSQPLSSQMSISKLDNSSCNVSAEKPPRKSIHIKTKSLPTSYELLPLKKYVPRQELPSEKYPETLLAKLAG